MLAVAAVVGDSVWPCARLITTIIKLTHLISVHAQTERDVSVRQRAVDLLYAMCDKSNAEEIVAEMLAYLKTADYAIREEMVSSV